MDVAGARALEQRIAGGKPVEDARPQVPAPDGGRVETRLRPAVSDAPGIDVVVLEPRALPGKARSWVYVRALDGRLRRAR
jgi:hypothetical protein